MLNITFDVFIQVFHECALMKTVKKAFNSVFAKAIKFKNPCAIELLYLITYDISIPVRYLVVTFLQLQDQDNF